MGLGRPFGTSVEMVVCVRYQASISDDSGKVALGGSSDSFNEPPTFVHVFRRMREIETYLIRQRIREERAHAAQMTALALYRFEVGQTFTNVNLGQHGRANRIELTSVDPKTGDITFNAANATRTCTREEVQSAFDYLTNPLTAAAVWLDAERTAIVIRAPGAGSG